MFVVIDMSALFTDINECTTHSDRCQHTCVNTDGGYHCACHSGYVTDTKDAHKCTGCYEH